MNMSRAIRFTMPRLPALYGTDNNLLGFELSFLCSGHIYKAFVRARNVQSAAEEATIELAAAEAGFEPENARLISAIQTV